MEQANEKIDEFQEKQLNHNEDHHECHCEHCKCHCHDEEVQEAANIAAPKFKKLVKDSVARFGEFLK